MLFKTVRVLSACAVREKTSGESEKPVGVSQRVFRSGDVLLSHDLSSHYHRGCSVSLPCSEWERVVPLRYYHQKFAPKTGANFWRRDSCFVKSLHRRKTSDSRFPIHVRFSKNGRFPGIYIRGCDSRFVTPLQRSPDSRF